MKRSYFLIFSISFLALTFSSCSNADTLSFDTVLGRLKGKWKVEKVRMHTKGKIGKSNVTMNFKDMELNFMDNDSLTLFDPKSNTTYPGYWELYEHESWDEDDQEYDYSTRLYMFVQDPNDPYLYRDIYWKDMNINSRKFSAKEKRHVVNKTYTYYYDLVSL